MNGNVVSLDTLLGRIPSAEITFTSVGQYLSLYLYNCFIINYYYYKFYFILTDNLPFLATEEAKKKMATLPPLISQIETLIELEEQKWRIDGGEDNGNI